MHNITYSNQAKTDLEDAISCIAKESMTNALNYLRNYEDKIELLRLNPYMGAECKNKLIKRDCRVLVYESHIIIYNIDKNLDNILIIIIYHGSVDYANKFNKKIKNEQK